MIISEQLKQIIYWIGLGCSLIVYAHANFSTKSEVVEIKQKINAQANKEDIARVEAKVDSLLLLLVKAK